jgi:hypothetical protein
LFLESGKIHSMLQPSVCSGDRSQTRQTLADDRFGLGHNAVN